MQRSTRRRRFWIHNILLVPADGGRYADLPKRNRLVDCFVNHPPKGLLHLQRFDRLSVRLPFVRHHFRNEHMHVRCPVSVAVLNLLN